MNISYFESKGVFNGKAIRPKNGDSLVSVELRDLLEKQKTLQKGTVKGQYGTFYQYNSPVKLEKSEIERNFTKTSLVAVDIDHMKNDLADIIFYNFEEIFENIPGFFACCYSFSHNLHIFVEVESNNIEEFTKNYEDITYTLAFALKCYFNPSEEIGKYLADENKLGRSYKNSEDVFDIHNSSISQSLDLASSDYVWVENKGTFVNTFAEYGKRVIDVAPVKKRANLSFTSKIAKSVVFDRSFFKSSGVEVHTGTIDGLGGNEARMFVASCIKKYFGDEAENVIRSTFSDDINEYIAELKTSKAGKVVKGIVEKWCFENIPAFKGLVSNKIDWDQIDDVDLSVELLKDIESLADKTVEIKDGEYLFDSYSRIKLGKKSIVVAPCGSGKSYLMRKIGEKDKTIIFAPYASIQRLYHKENIECYNLEALNNGKIKSGYTVYIDEAHLILTDSQFRDKVTKEVELLVKRNDVNIKLFTGTPTKEFITELKKVGFEYINFYFENKDKYKKVKYANVQFTDMTRSIDSILKSVYSLVRNEYNTGEYDSVVICTNNYNRILQKLGVIELDHFISSDSYRNEKEKSSSNRSNVWEFCDGRSWRGIYVMTRYGFAGIDNQEESNNLYVFFNSETTKTDLIQATNRTRKGNDKVVCINDSNFSSSRSSRLTYFGMMYFMNQVETEKSQICSIGTSTTIDKVDTTSSNINSLKKAILKEVSGLLVKGDFIVNQKGNVVSRLSESIRKSWNNFANKDDYYNSFIDFEEFVELRAEIKDDNTFCKAALRYNSIKKKTRMILDSRNFKDYREMLVYKIDNSLVLAADYWNKLSGSVEEMSKLIKKDLIELLKAKDNGIVIYNDNFTMLTEYKGYINNSGELFGIILDQLARNIIEVKRTIEFGKNFDKTYNPSCLEEMYKKLVEEEEKKQNDAFKNADIDKWFNDTETVEFNGKTISFPIHNDKLDSKGKAKGKAIGKAIGKAVKEKFCLKSDNSIKFKTKEECFDYYSNNKLGSKTFDQFNKRDWKNYFDKI